MRSLLALVLAPILALATANSSARISVVDAWARPAPPTLKVGAAYLSIVNGGKPDRLLSADTVAADRVEFHETRSVNGLMQMRQVPYVDCPAGSTKAAPGGLHIMLLGLKQPLAPGTHFPLILHFRDAGQIAVSVAVEARE